MPAFDLPAQDMSALIEHLRTLVPVSNGAQPAEVRKTVETTDGQSLEGRVWFQVPGTVRGGLVLNFNAEVGYATAAVRVS